MPLAQPTSDNRHRESALFSKESPLYILSSSGKRHMSKVFISHRMADAKEAVRLAGAIQGAGHEVWLDEWEIGVGDNIVRQIQSGLRDADYVVLCLSTDGVESNWISQEWMTALARQLENEEIKLLPVRLTGGDLPAILAGTKYADMTADWSKGLEALLRAIR